MGYNTTYTITKLDGDAVAFGASFNKHPQATAEGYKWFGVGMPSEDFKWYEHEKHIADTMLATDTKHVELAAEGEENGDRWDKVFDLIDDQVIVKTFRHVFVREEKPSERRVRTGPPPPSQTSKKEDRRG